MGNGDLKCDGNYDCTDKSDEIECASTPDFYGECGKNQNSIDFTWDNRIIGGNRASNNSYPWSVSLFYSNEFFCSGTIISENFVLTSYSCVKDRNLSLIGGKVGSSDRTRGSKISFSNLATYSEGSSDIAALLYVKGKIEFNDRTSPICLPTESTFLEETQECIATGWGITTFNRPQGNDNLYQVRLPIVNDEKCNVSYPEFDSDAKICAGGSDVGRNGSRGVCNLDNGGPLMCHVEGSWVQFGLISSMLDCGEGQPTAFEDLRRFSSWIQDTMEAVENECDESSLNNCNENSECVDTFDSYYCDCNEGYINNGTAQSECIDVNECEEYPEVCGEESLKCTNFEGGFNCSCKQGYVANSTNCLNSTEFYDICNKFYKINNESSGFILSPNFPNDYTSETDCTKVIKSRPGKVLEVFFNAFEVEASLSCSFDLLNITIGNETYSGHPFCEDHQPLNFTTDEEVRFQFISDDSVNFQGFNITWQFVEGCDEDSFRCWDGTCIPSSEKCDGLVSCPNDNSDEVECANPSSTYGECGKNENAVQFTWDYRIVGGNRATNNSYPWTVPLFNYEGQFCGATIINENFLVTAAHCLSYENAESVWGYLGTNDLNDQSNRVNFTRIISHPDYDTFTAYADIALLETSRPIDFNGEVSPICIPSPEDVLEDDEICLAVGWGALFRDGPFPDVLHQVRLPIVNSETCALRYQVDDFELPNNTFCAGDIEKGGVDSCQGDSGGAMLCLRGNSWVQYGVISVGSGCADAKFPGIYTDMRYYFNWIQNSMKPRTTLPETTTPHGGTTTPDDGTTTPGDGTTTPHGGTTTPHGDTTTPETTTRFVPNRDEIVRAVRVIASNINPIPRLLSFWINAANKDDRYIDETHSAFLTHVARVQRFRRRVQQIRQMRTNGVRKNLKL